jgi:hypothetical protein
MSDKITAEKLQAVYENSEQVKALNTELESILYGTDTGGKSWYDMFWDSYQANGTRHGYNNAFGNEKWNDENYKPKYDMLGIHSGYQMFAYSQISNAQKTIEITGSAAYLFASSWVVTIPLLIVRETAVINGWFNSTTRLENITIDGVIPQSIAFAQSTKLNKASIQSIISHLSDTASGMTLTLSKMAVNNAFEGGSTGDEWLNLVSTKPNWTISLA